LYGTFNCGVGFALYVAASDVDATIAAADSVGHHAWHAGEIEAGAGRRAVEIPKLGLVYESDSLKLRS
jgi:phosphoribosylformylglycinamidine cyclo-ligase